MTENVSSSYLFSATRPLLALEHFRTPYSTAAVSRGRGVEELRALEGGSALLWPSAPADHARPTAALLGGDGTNPIPLFASIVADIDAESLLAAFGGSWTPAVEISDLEGGHLASIWRREDGTVFLPFDPDEVQLNLLSERYHQITVTRSARRLRAVAMRAYYRSRGCTPRPVRIWMRRRFATIQARSQFPRWPIETCLHDFLEFFHSLLQSIVDEPVPRIASWPNGHTWALVLTHDVETSLGVQALDPVLELEQSLGLRSSWNFVPRRSGVDRERARALTSAGFEIGVHGLYHDGRDLESAAMVRARLPLMHEAAVSWGAVGFRSPATHRRWDLMPMLGFDYDSSYPDTDPFEPHNGGCCSWLPFFNEGLVELPMTMTMDHTLFVILRHRDEQAWVRKAEFLRSRGGMASIDTHPDYLADDTVFKAYRRFLERFADDPDAWKALPREVSAWWRSRSESRLERTGEGWQVVGPVAGDARVEYCSEHERPLSLHATAILQQCA